MAKAIILYPKPEDPDLFMAEYQKDHVRLMGALPDLEGYKLTHIKGSPQGRPPFWLMVEMYFPTMEQLQNAFMTDAGAATAKHAGELSTGGPFVVMVAEDEEVKTV